MIWTRRARLEHLMLPLACAAVFACGKPFDEGTPSQGGATTTATGAGAGGGETSSTGSGGEGGQGAAPPVLIWSADHETGDLSQWTADGRGGATWLSANGEAAVYPQLGRSSSHALLLGIGAPYLAVNMAQQCRWGVGEEDLPLEATYGAWLKLDNAEPATSYWMLMSFGYQTAASLETSLAVDVVFQNGVPHVGVFDHLAWEAVGMAGVALPVGEWVHLEGLFRADAGSQGKLVLRQDGTEIVRIEGRPTSTADALRVAWCVVNGSDGFASATMKVIVDDASIEASAL